MLLALEYRKNLSPQSNRGLGYSDSSQLVKIHVPLLCRRRCSVLQPSYRTPAITSLFVGDEQIVQRAKYYVSGAFFTVHQLRKRRPPTGDLNVASLNPPPPRCTSHLRNSRALPGARPDQHHPPSQRRSPPCHLPRWRLAFHRRPVRNRSLRLPPESPQRRLLHERAF